MESSTARRWFYFEKLCYFDPIKKTIIVKIHVFRGDITNTTAKENHFWRIQCTRRTSQLVFLASGMHAIRVFFVCCLKQIVCTSTYHRNYVVKLSYRQFHTANCRRKFWAVPERLPNFCNLSLWVFFFFCIQGIYRTCQNGVDQILWNQISISKPFDHDNHFTARDPSTVLPKDCIQPTNPKEWSVEKLYPKVAKRQIMYLHNITI